MEKDRLRNNVSRFLGLFAFFWSTIIPFLGFPFFAVSIFVVYKSRNTKDGFFNIVFDVVGIALSTIYCISYLVYYLNKI
jgi:hypothetical protein